MNRHSRNVTGWMWLDPKSMGVSKVIQEDELMHRFAITFKRLQNGLGSMPVEVVAEIYEESDVINATLFLCGRKDKNGHIATWRKLPAYWTEKVGSLGSMERGFLYKDDWEKEADAAIAAMRNQLK